jgi:hypothetical protein
MATSLSTIGAGTMDSLDLESRFVTIQTWLNGGMVAGDLASGNWAKSRYIFAPEFFGTPAPMTRMTFGDVHYRVRPHGYAGAHHQHSAFRATDGSNYIPVDGLQATIDIDETTDMKVTASYWAWATQGTGHAMEDHKVAEFLLGYQTGSTITTKSETIRELRCSGTSNSKASAKQFHHVYYFTGLSAGVYHVGVRNKLTSTALAEFANVYVTARNLTIKLFPKA